MEPFMRWPSGYVHCCSQNPFLNDFMSSNKLKPEWTVLQSVCYCFPVRKPCPPCLQVIKFSRFKLQLQPRVPEACKFLMSSFVPSLDDVLVRQNIFWRLFSSWLLLCNNFTKSGAVPMISIQQRQSESLWRRDEHFIFRSKWHISVLRYRFTVRL